MKKKKVWRYYCEYCKKSGCSGGHMKNHEKHCTMNPNRECRMCRMVDSEQVEINRILKILPAPTECWKEDERFGGYIGLGEPVEKVLPELRELVGNCPACIMSALRQKGIPVPLVEGFDFKAECKEIWANINDANSQDAW